MRGLWRAWAVAAFAALSGEFARAEVLRLTPADPQPDAAELTQGLAVQYAYPPEVKTLHEAEGWLSGKEPGEPLTGLYYIETLEGEITLTSRQATRVVAEITGYVHFPKAGAQKVEFYSNDGLKVSLGGQVVSTYDGRHPCESPGYQDVEIPAPGWYEISMLYFQRLNTACLLMKWDVDAPKLGWAPDEAFAYRK